MTRVGVARRVYAGGSQLSAMYLGDKLVGRRRRNVLLNPSGAAGGSPWGASVATVATGPALGPFATSAQWRRTATGASRFTARAPYLANTRYALRLALRASETLAGVTFALRPTDTVNTNQTVFTIATIPAGVSEVTFSIVTNATVPTASAALALTHSSGAVNATLDVVGTLEAIPLPVSYGPIFDGSSDPRAEWTGTPNASPSTLWAQV